MRGIASFLIAISIAGCAHVSSGSAVVTSPVVRVAGTDSILAHETFTIQSTAIGEQRRVNVYTPPSYGTSRAKFPVLYMPDGGLDEDFPHVAKTVDSLISLGTIRPIIVVGIPNTQRRRDLTGPTRFHADSAIAAHVGGSEAFRSFIEAELIPRIDVLYRTTPERGIMGESLAGLFIVETFLQEPSLFAHYIAFDPSVWWNGGALIDSAQSSIARIRGKPRTLYVVTSVEPSTAVGSAKLAGMLRSASLDGLRLTYLPRVDLTHATIFRAAKPAALIDAFKVATGK